MTASSPARSRSELIWPPGMTSASYSSTSTASIVRSTEIGSPQSSCSQPQIERNDVDLGAGFLEPSLRHDQLRLHETVGREHGDPFAVKFVHGNNLLACRSAVNAPKPEI